MVCTWYDFNQTMIIIFNKSSILSFSLKRNGKS